MRRNDNTQGGSLYFNRVSTSSVQAAWRQDVPHSLKAGDVCGGWITCQGTADVVSAGGWTDTRMDNF